MYILTRAELLFTLCYEIPCSLYTSCSVITTLVESALLAPHSEGLVYKLASYKNKPAPWHQWHNIHSFSFSSNLIKVLIMDGYFLFQESSFLFLFIIL
jgi:hypothetical protein